MAQSAEKAAFGRQMARILGPRKVGTVYGDSTGVHKVEKIIIEWDDATNSGTYILATRYQVPSCCYDEVSKIDWHGNAWEYDKGHVFSQPDLPNNRVNVYLHYRGYGGPEEGGWYYSSYSPVKSVRVKAGQDAEEIAAKLREEYGDDGDGYGRYVVYVENHYPREDWGRPHYC